MIALLGGWHCAGMCGPIAALTAKPREIALYQSGRLTSYLILALLASLFGAQALGWIPEDRRWIFTVALGLFSIWVLFSSWNLDFPMRLQKILWRNRPRGSAALEAYSLGVLNGLIPCHWLYSFLLVAAGLGHPTKGLLLLASLWAGSMPWLLGFSSLSSIAKRRSPQSRWIARILLATVLLGLVAQGFMHGDSHLGCKLSEL